MTPLLIFNHVYRGSVEVSQTSFTARMIALQQLVERHDGHIIEIQNPRIWSSRIFRALRPLTVMMEVHKAKPGVVITQYPNYPFFWSLDRSLDVKRSLMFARMLGWYCRRAGIILVVDQRDIVRAEQATYPRSLFERFERSVFGGASVIWTQSLQCWERTRKLYGLSVEHVRSVPNGCFEKTPSQDGYADDGTVRFIYAGDLRTGDRGTEQLIAALAQSKNPRCRFILCGHNSKWLEEAQLDHRIEVLGQVTRSQVMEMYGQAHVGMIPHPYGGNYDLAFPTKLGEYVCSGLAVLCTDRGVTADYVNTNGVGIAAPFGAWPEAIDRLASDVPLLRSYRAQAYRLSDSLLWDRLYDDALSSLAACGPSAGRRG